MQFLTIFQRSFAFFPALLVLQSQTKCLTFAISFQMMMSALATHALMACVQMASMDMYVLVSLDGLGLTVIPVSRRKKLKNCYKFKIGKDLFETKLHFLKDLLR